MLYCEIPHQYMVQSADITRAVTPSLLTINIQHAQIKIKSTGKLLKSDTLQTIETPVVVTDEPCPMNSSGMVSAW